MNDIEVFIKLMRQGHGRCAVILAESDVREVYRDAVLEGCRKNFAYDDQCEGTRGWFVHRLTEFFEDKREFVSAAADAFGKTECSADWDFHHLCDLLALFARDGNTEAADALRMKYYALRHILLVKNEMRMLDHDRDCFNYLAGNMVRVWGEDAFLSAVSDIGTIISKNEKYDGEDFDQFEFDAEQALGKDKVRSVLAESTDAMTLLYQNSIAEACERRHAYAESVRKQTPAATTPRRKEIYDADELIKTLHSTTAEYEDGYASGHHGAAIDLLRARELGLAVPDEVLVQIYETTLCSCCRFKAVRILADTGKMHEDMIRECLSDCYGNTRKLAEEIGE